MSVAEQPEQDGPGARPLPGDASARDVRPPESSRSADDDDLAQTFGIDSVADGSEHGADGLPTVDSPASRPRPAPVIPSPYRARSDSAPSEAGHTDGAAGDGAAVHGSADKGGGDQSPPPNGRRSARRRKKPRGKAPWWELPLLIAIAVVIAIVVKTFVIQPFYIPSQSMEQTLHGCPGCSGDRVLVFKPVYDVRDPHPGDIVVFSAPVGWDDEPTPVPPSNPVLRVIRGFGQLVGFVPPDERDLIKRVIAVGGQTVQCCDSQGRVQVADSPSGPFRSLDEPYVYRDGPDFWSPQDKPGSPLLNPADSRTFGPVTVPTGRLWVMGDHRNNSADSAYHWRTQSQNVEASTVPVKSVIGKAIAIAWPPSRWRTLGTPATFAAALGSALGTPVPVGVLLATAPVALLRRRRR